jgi:hypothetical protein
LRTSHQREEKNVRIWKNMELWKWLSSIKNTTWLWKKCNPSWRRVCVVQIKFSVHPPPWLKHKWFGVFKMNFSTELVIMGDMEFTQVLRTMKCWLFIREKYIYPLQTITQLSMHPSNYQLCQCLPLTTKKCHCLP